MINMKYNGPWKRLMHLTSVKTNSLIFLLANLSQDADLALITDTIDFGLGASLNEITSSGFKRLGFFSKKLTSAQTK